MDDFDYGMDWTGYDFGDSGYSEPFNYEPAGYSEDWNNPEHYAYEPSPFSLSDYESRSDAAEPAGDLFSGETPSKSNYNNLGRWGENTTEKESTPTYYGGSRSSGGGGGSDSLRNTLTYSSRRATKPMPSFSGPTLSIPSWDTERIKRLRQSKANPGISSLRQATNRAMILSRALENPYAARQSLREALSGYGSGLSNVMKEADVEAANEYGTEYEASVNKAKAEHAAAWNTAQMIYQAALQDYLNSFENITTTSRY